jgi:hypothetical protein
MNVAVMTSGALCLCAQVPAAQASARASVSNCFCVIVSSQGKPEMSFQRILWLAREVRIEVVILTWNLVECVEMQRKS